MILVAFSSTGCISVSLDEVDADSDLKWDTLKRDQILMTPLMDMRGDTVAPPGMENQLAAFSEAERIKYAESFKQTFFKLRKDIRVFGAGGAFEKISSLPNLSEIAAKILKKQSLNPADIERIRDSNQDIRFLFVFAFTGEQLRYQYNFDAPLKKNYVIKSYVSERSMEITMALWDSKTAKTVWIGKKTLTPSSVNTVKIRKYRLGDSRAQRAKETEILSDPDQWDFGVSNLDHELQFHRSRFPGFPGREPAFSGSFQHFALGFPIHPSEEKLIEYSYFTHHRAEVGAGSSGVGKKYAPQIFLTLSSIINNRFRLGLGIYGDGQVSIQSQGKKYDISSSGMGFLSDLEWTLNDKWRLLTGATVGGAVFSLDDPLTSDLSRESGGSGDTTSDQQSQPDFHDFVKFARPRIHFLYGNRRGGQLGFGVHGMFYDGIDRPELKANKPVAWGFDVSASYTIRGF